MAFNRIIHLAKTPVSGGAGSVIPTTGLQFQWPLISAPGSPPTTPELIDAFTNTDGINADGQMTIGAVGPGTHNAAVFPGFSGTRFEMQDGAGGSRNWPGVDFQHASHSVCFWGKLTDNTAAGPGGNRQTFFCAVDSSRGCGIRICNNTIIGPGSFGVGYAPGTGTGPSTAAGAITSTIKHFCVTNSGGGESGTIKLYVNAVDVTSGVTSSVCDPDTSNGVDIGSIINGTANITGAMYQLLVYNNVVLTPTDVTAIYNNGLL